MPAGPGRRAAGRPGPAHLQLRLGQLAYEQALLDAGCRISHDGRGRATDNAFIERLWRTVKWEHIYPNPADDGHHLYHQLQAYFAYYNYRRPHQNLGGQTPAQVFAQPSLPKYKHIT